VTYLSIINLLDIFYISLHYDLCLIFTSDLQSLISQFPIHPMRSENLEVLYCIYHAASVTVSEGVLAGRVGRLETALLDITLDIRMWIVGYLTVSFCYFIVVINTITSNTLISRNCVWTALNKNVMRVDERVNEWTRECTRKERVSGMHEWRMALKKWLLAFYTTATR